MNTVAAAPMSRHDATLHYLYDPLCGWCYGSAPLIAAAEKIAGLKVQFHSGGMMSGIHRRPIDAYWRDHVMPHDRRIAELSGQPFSDAYYDNLLRDTSVILDSAPPTTAALAAEAMSGRGLPMIHRLQRAHYVDARRIADSAVLEEIAGELGLDVDAFRRHYAQLAGTATTQHFAATQQRLAAAGGQGFPTLILEFANGQSQRLEVGRWPGQAAAWAKELARRLVASGANEERAPASRRAAGPRADTAHCDTDHCAF
ncbi:DsbA family protein [Rhodocyclus gracilis]|nr:DsbA family protein [Rhodocyclus gracilis]